jgi:hypothetical protein
MIVPSRGAALPPKRARFHKGSTGLVPPVHSVLSHDVRRRATSVHVPLMTRSLGRRFCSSAVLSSSSCVRGTIPIAGLDPTPWRSFRHDREGETTMSTRPGTTDESLVRNGH